MRKLKNGIYLKTYLHNSMKRQIYSDFDEDIWFIYSLNNIV